MASKRGVIITGVILAAITAASFAVWLVPQNSGTEIITTDHANLLDGTIAIRGALEESLNESYAMLQDGSITPDEYAQSADIMSGQVTDQIRTLASAEPPAEWAESYAQYIESYRALNSLIRETIVMSEAISSGGDTADVETRISELRELSAAYAHASDALRP